MSYNALQISGRKRLSGGLELTGFYVWSKSIMENLGYYGCGSVNSRRRVLAGCLQPPRQPRSGVLRCPAQRLHRRSLQSAVRQGPDVRPNWNRAVGPDPRRLERQLLHERPLGLPGHRVRVAANTGGRTPRGNVRANAYRPYVISTSDRRRTSSVRLRPRTSAPRA